MPFSVIVRFSLRAAGFACAAILVFELIRFLLRKRRGCRADLGKELIYGLFVFYFAALVNITVIRGGVGFGTLITLERSMDTVQLIPLYYTLMEIESGIWALIYPIAGNVLWFIPFGFLLPLMGLRRPMRRGNHPLGRILLLSLGVSVCIEALQWVFGTGISDIDDVLFNVLGAGLGYGLFLLFCRRLFPGVKGKDLEDEDDEKAG